MWTKFFFGFAHFLQWTFGILHFFQNWVNYAFVIIGIVLFLLWFKYQDHHDKIAEKNGTLH